MKGRLRKRITNSVNYKPQTLSTQEYGFADLNWKDSGGTFNEPKEVEDPSMNDFIKGYNMDSGRYEFKQWAKNKKKNIKFAAQEVVDISYTPEALVKRILTLWRNNGPIQDFFDGFTSNQKMTNKLKKEIAEILCSMGHDIVPTLHDETPRYANKKNSEIFEIVKSAKSYMEDGDIVGLTVFFQDSFPDSDFMKELSKDINKISTIIDTDSFRGLVDYYDSIFPKDFASKLLNVTLDKAKDDFEEFRDESISNELLRQMDKFDKGEQNPMSNNPNNGGIGGYDFISDMRGDGPGGVAPNMYETRIAKKKRFLQQR